jgi:hypothetical protein
MVHLTAEGFAPGGQVRIDYRSTQDATADVRPGTVADDNGRVDLDLEVPSDAADSDISAFEVIGLAPDGDINDAVAGFLVNRAAPCGPSGAPGPSSTMGSPLAPSDPANGIGDLPTTGFPVPMGITVGTGAVLVVVGFVLLRLYRRRSSFD